MLNFHYFPEILLDIFSNCCIYFHDFNNKDELKRLTRYVIAYDGDVAAYLSSDVTHIICKEKSGKDTLEDVTNIAKIVSVKWIDDCIKERMICIENEYLIE